MAAELKCWFVRDLLQVIERERPGTAERLRERLSERVRRCVDLEALRACGPVESVPLADAEELFFAADNVLGDSSARLLESMGTELTGRMLFQEGSAVIVGDMIGTLARLRTSLERPFVGADVVLELTRTEAGFNLQLGVSGYPRATRLLRHLAVGAIRAAQRYSHEPNTTDLKISGEPLGDRATLAVSYRSSMLEPTVPPPAIVEPPRRRAPSNRPPPRVTSLTEEVARILGPRLPADSDTSQSARPIRRTSTSQFRAVRPPAEPSNADVPSDGTERPRKR